MKILSSFTVLGVFVCLLSSAGHKKGHFEEPFLTIFNQKPFNKVSGVQNNTGAHLLSMGLIHETFVNIWVNSE